MKQSIQLSDHGRGQAGKSSGIFFPADLRGGRIRCGTGNQLSLRCRKRYQYF